MTPLPWANRPESDLPRVQPSRVRLSLAQRPALIAAALALLSICSCHASAPGGGGGALLSPGYPNPADGYAANDSMMAAGMMANGRVPSVITNGSMMAPPQNAMFGQPLPQMLVTQWAPPGIALPWPHDEYLADGGDKEVPVSVNRDGQVNGLEMEDTVVHFDTLDGHTLVEPSNRVHIYAPRFAAVRSVEDTRLTQRRDQIVASHAPIGPQVEVDRWLATTAMQPVQPVGETGVRQPSLTHLKQGEGVLLTQAIPYSTQDHIGAYEDFEIIRLGTFDDTQQARLVESVDAAIVWSADQAVQVVIDKVEAHVEIGDQKVQSTFRVDLPTNPQLRVVKLASTNQARPGDIIDFTIRYDNVGDAAIGNVTLIDNLTTRLEYVEGSAKSSRDGQFFTDPNAGDSLALRWELAEPLDPGQGGLVRFQCRVR